MLFSISKSLKRAVATASLMLIALTLLTSGFAKDKQKAAPAPKPKTSKPWDRIGVDISKLVWPQPPDVARLKYLDLYTGQKIDWDKVKKLVADNSKNHKLSWKDKLAGTDPRGIANSDFKMPFQLMNPTCVALSAKGGRIYIGDPKVGAIFIYNPEDKSTVFIIAGKNAHLGMMAGLAIDDDETLFVSDAKLHRVTVISSKGDEVSHFGSDLMVSPAGIALNRENRLLYVVDAQLDQVLVYDADTYKLMKRIGTTGKKHTLMSPGDFSTPTHVAIDSDGNIFVTDTLNNRVEMFDSDGNFIREFGKAGDGPGRFGRPKGIAVDPDGHVWVADALLQRVQVFDQEGRLLMIVGQAGQIPGMFSSLDDIAIDANNRVATTELFPARVQVFRYVSDQEAAVELVRRDKELAEKAAAKKNSPTAASKPDAVKPDSKSPDTKSNEQSEAKPDAAAVAKSGTKSGTKPDDQEQKPAATPDAKPDAQAERPPVDHSKFLGFGDHRQSGNDPVPPQSSNK